MRKRRVLAFVLAAIMVLSMTACANGSSNSSEPVESETSSDTSAASDTTGASDTEGKTWDKISEVIFYYPVYFNIPSEEGIAQVEDALNEYTRDKIGVEVKLKPIDYFAYSEQMNLILSSSEQVDIFCPLTGLSSYMSKGQLASMEECRDELSATIDLMGEDFLKASIINDELYAVPAYKAVTLPIYYIYRKDIVDELGYDMSKVENVEDLEELLTQVKDNYPDIYPLVPTNAGDQMLTWAFDGTDFGYNVDYLGDSINACTGCLVNNGTTVENFYETECFERTVNLAYDWYQKGLLMPETSVSPDTASDLFPAGRGFSTLVGYGYSAEGVKRQYNSGINGDFGYDLKIVAGDIMTSSSFNTEWSIGYTSPDPEAAARFLNLLYVDEYVINLVIYGIEGVDYVLNDDATTSYPEGMSAETVPYTALISCGLIGNNFLMYNFTGIEKDFGLDLIKNAKSSNALGFAFDSSSVKTQVTAVQNVISQYYDGLVCGEMKPDEVLPQFIADLKSAGIDTIIEEKQAQLDAWFAK